MVAHICAPSDFRLAFNKPQIMISYHLSLDILLDAGSTGCHMVLSLVVSTVLSPVVCLTPCHTVITTSRAPIPVAQGRQGHQLVKQNVKLVSDKLCVCIINLTRCLIRLWCNLWEGQTLWRKELLCIFKRIRNSDRDNDQWTGWECF